LQNFLKQFKPKKYKAYNKYVIVSAVYNVEKYLDDFFKSIINQRLDFKNNIHLICVDDGSTDNSANIIKKYQKKYPKNIIYLYKENGGQASARNLGLKYLKENDLNIPWVTFTDPDDFLDRD
ncbi:glycosyltransferase family A protein, partial [Campylobacter jejuni]